MAYFCHVDIRKIIGYGREATSGRHAQARTQTGFCEQFYRGPALSEPGSALLHLYGGGWRYMTRPAEYLFRGPPKQSTALDMLSTPQTLSGRCARVGTVYTTQGRTAFDRGARVLD
ncbi:hypothetical protein J6590_037766 [Homalodisca vitripennis]|nr:hypothetical protein J6590_037766 [Homalodisca vitripennis]